MKRTLFYILALCFMIQTPVCAQSLPDMTLSLDFKAEVKSLEEFMARFNGDEIKPGIANDKNLRKNNILGLFDSNINKKGASREQFVKELSEFVDSVIVNNTRFSISNSRLLAECVCKMKYKKKSINLTIVLQSEEYKKNMFRWTIVGIKGLSEAGILPVDKIYPISPAEHEIHFIGLHDYLNANPSHAYGYRGKNVKIDPLTVFLTLVYDGSLLFDIVEKQTFLFYDIPGYVISINEITRSGQNSGWLITSFEKLTDKEKQKQIKKVLGYE